MRQSEFWSRMEDALGPTYARAWAETFVIGELDSRTVQEALAGGETTKRIWLAVWRTLDLPLSER